MKRLFITLVALLNVCALAALWGCVLSTRLTPAAHPRLAILGLAFPAILAVNAAFFFVWLLLGRRLLWLPVVGLGAAYSYVLDYCPLRPTPVPPEGGLKVITYNVHGYGLWRDGKRDDAAFMELVHYLCESDADIIALQEAQTGTVATANLIDTLSRHGYSAAQHRELLLLARGRILAQTPIEYASRGGNCSCAFLLALGGDTLSYVANHLESDRISRDHMADYADAIHNPDAVSLGALGRSFVDLLSSAASVRGKQVDAVAGYLDRLPQGRSVILSGDFNDTPISYAYQQIARRLRSAYREGGSGVGLTFSLKKFPVRIDHLFASHDWTVAACLVDRSVRVSDHFPVVAWLEKGQK